MGDKQKDSTFRWWQTGTVYQIYPRSFQDSSGNGVGDLKGIIERLDYLNDGTRDSLGIDAIWISPFFTSPMADFGYDVADYCDVDPLFGDLRTFDRLLAEAHERGIKVIIDWVPNHTSDQHAWFKESRSSRVNPKRDWYIWRDPKPDGCPPNNWGSFFGGPAWTLDESTGQFYLHQFVKEQPELNWRNPEVKAAMLDTLRFWLDRGVDGFRMDVIALIIKDEQLRDNPTNPHAADDLPDNDLFSRLLNVHNLDQEEVHPVLREIRSVIDEYDDRVAIGELWAPLERWVRFYGEKGDELHMPFNFGLIDLRFDAQTMRRHVDQLEGILPPFAWPNYVLGNHDKPRLASRFGGQAQARLAAMMLLTLRGTPTLYYGDELGLEDGDIPREMVQDPQGVNLGHERTRDVCRTPMQWDNGRFAGFSTTAPWLPISEDASTRNAAAQAKDPHSMISFYKQLLWLRRESDALKLGTYQPVDSYRDCFVFWRWHGGERLLVALNFSEETRDLSLADEGSYRAALSTHETSSTQTVEQRLTLSPFEGIIIEVSG